MQEKLPENLREKERRLKWGLTLKTAKEMKFKILNKKTHGRIAVKKRMKTNMDLMLIRVNFKDMMVMELKVQLMLENKQKKERIHNTVKDSLINLPKL